MVFPQHLSSIKNKHCLNCQFQYSLILSSFQIKKFWANSIVFLKVYKLHIYGCDKIKSYQQYVQDHLRLNLQQDFFIWNELKIKEY